ncbi:MAG: Lar family restriction alleviation protein [Bacilli bacterium]|nr:Lar family restriction alleviation protein [Bacilli bacterium]
MIELKPCPICYSEAKVRYKMPFSWVECKNKYCGFHTQLYGDWYEQGDGKIESIEAWNRRASE